MRIAAIDVLRGLCMVLVVWGHNDQFTDTALNQWLGAIRMPMMFFIAGSFLPTQSTWRALAWDKADALLKPFIVMALLQAPLRWYLGQTDPSSFAIGLLAGGGHYLVWIFPLWYLTHLWWLFMVGHAVVNHARYARWDAMSRVALVAALMLFGAWLAQLDLDAASPDARAAGWQGMPFRLDALPTHLAYFLLGHEARQALRAWSGAWPRLLSSTLLFAGGQYWLNRHSVTEASGDLVAHTVIGLLTTLAGMSAMASVAVRLASWSWARTVLARCGRDSLLILLFHSPLQSVATRWLEPAGGTSGGWGTGLLAWAFAVAGSLSLAVAIRRHPILSRCWLPRSQWAPRPTHNRASPAVSAPTAIDETAHPA